MKHWIGYHGDCLDGFGAAFLLASWLRSPPNTQDFELHPLSHGEPAPNVGDDIECVWLLDFANVGIEWLDDVLSAKLQVRILDHHVTALDLRDESIASSHNMVYRDRIEELPATSAFFCIDQNHSGIGLVAAYIKLMSSVDPDRLFQYWHNIEDQDLHRFNRAGTAEINAAISSYKQDLETWEELHYTSREELMTEGAAILRYEEKIIEGLVKSPFNLHISGLGWVKAIIAPYQMGSFAAHSLYQAMNTKVAAYVILKSENVKIGLRSSDDGPDVEHVAKQHHGGGHTHAASFEYSYEEFEQNISEL